MSHKLAADEEMESENKKMEAVVKMIQNKEQLDKQSLHDAFLCISVGEVTEKVMNSTTFISISLSQLVEQLFIQLDKDNTGFIPSSTLLDLLPSSHEPSTSPSVSPAPSWGVFTHSPSSPPCVLHPNEHTDDSLPNSLATTSLFGSLDMNNLG